ncbi:MULTISPECIES: preprotein translocase subunit YajC [Uliginosibacterium]|uniref:Sec translocon accessory complex subunit YajC n=1 Tax=Uliginosibacterium aquaticum TaxID=2731212 RepID=A0ABX2ID79_9RHOO|nr:MULTISPECIES: preprotein translocase subunit YajC [Uliginosibacterium]MDO6386910.1 preprotein translocase subunit YajC [Uliginosibacterium sp. 31-12]NSL54530.1 preprotein translocase subunit YajC [Uliginosibacterium aquaticum]PLK49595.1 preprotein translocase subunit YajC [Uliginosibacterium sp. TH139]
MISDAFAQTAASSDPTGGWMGLLPMILMFVVLYFLMIRPQQKRAKEHKSLLDALAAGDEVITSGGIAGKVASVGENFVKIEIASGVEISVQKPAVATVLPKGTLKGA